MKVTRLAPSLAARNPTTPHPAPTSSTSAPWGVATDRCHGRVVLLTCAPGTLRARGPNREGDSMATKRVEPSGTHPRRGLPGNGARRVTLIGLDGTSNGKNGVSETERRQRWRQQTRQGEGNEKATRRKKNLPSPAPRPRRDSSGPHRDAQLGSPVDELAAHDDARGPNAPSQTPFHVVRLSHGHLVLPESQRSHTGSSRLRRRVSDEHVG